MARKSWIGWRMRLSVADIIMTHISLTLTVNKGDVLYMHCLLVTEIDRYMTPCRLTRRHI